MGLLKAINRVILSLGYAISALMVLAMFAWYEYSSTEIQPVALILALPFFFLLSSLFLNSWDWKLRLASSVLFLVVAWVAYPNLKQARGALVSLDDLVGGGSYCGTLVAEPMMGAIANFSPDTVASGDYSVWQESCRIQKLEKALTQNRRRICGEKTASRCYFEIVEYFETHDPLSAYGQVYLMKLGMDMAQQETEWKKLYSTEAGRTVAHLSGEMHTMDIILANLVVLEKRKVSDYPQQEAEGLQVAKTELRRILAALEKSVFQTLTSEQILEEQTREELVKEFVARRTEISRLLAVETPQGAAPMQE